MKMNALLNIDIESIEEIQEIFLEEDFEVHLVSETEHIFEEVAKGYSDIICLSGCCTANDQDVIARIRKIKELDPRLEIICIGDGGSGAAAIEIIKHGATACISYPVDRTFIKGMIRDIKENAHQRKEIYQFETALNEKYIFAGMVSRNPAMLDIFSLIRRIASYFRNTLIMGDTGTGKEVVARALHNLSNASDEPFIVCNCSGMVEDLIESELFGHVKGAFTGAVSDKAGLFEAAGKGTIFLDEIGHMPLNFQPHLLRVLQDGEFRPVGSTQSKQAECRVIAATNADLKEKINMGLFREDLYFRLAVITIELPALRERKEDIPLLIRFFLQRLKESIGKDIAGISMPAQRGLMTYDWPGNIRELENVIERAILVTSANFIRPQDLPAHVTNIEKKNIKAGTIDQLVKEHVQGVLRNTDGNKTAAASILGISRRALHRKIEKYGL